MLEKYSHQNLKGEDFSNQDLSEIDFSFSDIRGVNFKAANLCGANFTQVVAGQGKQQVFLLSVAALVLSAIAGFISAYASGISSSLFFANDPEKFGPRVANSASSLVVFLALSVFVVIALKRGLGAALGSYFIGIMAIVGIFAAGSNIDALAAVLILQAVALSIAVAGSMISAFAFSISRVVVGKRFVYAAIIATVAPAVLGGVEAISSISGTSSILEYFTALIISGLVTTALLGLGAYISWQAKSEDTRYAIIQYLAVVASSWGGTTFQYANLTDASFDKATLKKADFRSANLTRASFLNSKGLNQARLDSTYLSDKKIRQLAISRDGSNKDYSYRSLKGINLQGANLSESNFVGADLTDSSLRQADLSKAKLVRTQLYQADLTGSAFTRCVY